jgi:RND family efflux transporter MFP subunit
VATIVAPELGAQRSEAAARVQSAEAQRLEAAAQLAASTATHERLVAASKTPGIIAGHELELAAQAVAAGRARVQAARQSVAAAGQALSSLEAIESYLRVVSPFDGVVTERRVHPGSLVGPETSPLVRIQQVSSLRLVINVPEIDVGRVDTGHMVTFTVPAFPDRTFQGRVARVARALDPRTRSMTVEADVENAGGQLAPGMFAEVRWTAARVEPPLFVPASAVVTTTERTFVVRVRDGRAEWVDVRRGGSMDGLVEVFGSLQVGDQIAVRGTDEIRADTAVEVVAAG